MHGPASPSGGGAIRAPRLLFAFALAAVVAAIASAGPAQGSHGGSLECGDACVKVPLLFDPAVSPAAKPSGAQPGEEWDGSAPAPEPLGVTPAADPSGCPVLAGSESLAVEHTWYRGFGLG